MSTSHPKLYAEKINAGWNWIITGGSALAASTTARQPNWALGANPVSEHRLQKIFPSLHRSCTSSNLLSISILNDHFAKTN